MLQTFLAINSVFTRNTAGVAGGVTWSSSAARTTFLNCTLVSNTADSRGGAIEVASSGSVAVLNSILWGNSAPSGAQIYAFGEIKNTTAAFPTQSSPRAPNLIQGGTPGIALGSDGRIEFHDGSVLTGLPHFRNSAQLTGPEGRWGTRDDGLRLSAQSPARDAGHTALLPEDTFDLDSDGNTAERLPIDLIGFRRVQGDSVDLGAYEYGDEPNVVVLSSELTISHADGQLDVTLLVTPTETEWTVDGLPDWIEALDSTGTGSATIRLMVEGNASGQPRVAEFAVLGEGITVSQHGAPADYELSTDSVVMAAIGGSVELLLSMSIADAPWTIGDLPSWVSRSGQPNGVGNAELEFVVAENLSSRERTAEIAIADRILVVAQEGVVPEFVLSRTSADIGPEGGTVDVSLNATPSDSAWSVADLPEWITIETGGVENLRLEIIGSSDSGGTAWIDRVALLERSDHVTVEDGAWDQVITFDEYEFGNYRDRDDPIAAVARVTHDQGYQGGHRPGFGVHRILENGWGGKMYSLGTTSYGNNWGHVAAAINLDQPITDRGTWYFQARLDGSPLYTLALSDLAVVPLDPPAETNLWGSWGWSGPAIASHHEVSVLNDSGGIGVRDESTYYSGQFDWVSAAWYEFWVHIDVPAELYSVFLRSPDAGIHERTPLTIDLAGELHASYHTRSGAEQLQSVAISLGNPGSSYPENAMYINTMAFDFSEHNEAGLTLHNLVDNGAFGVPYQSDGVADGWSVHSETPWTAVRQEGITGPAQRIEWEAWTSGGPVLFQTLGLEYRREYVLSMWYKTAPGSTLDLRVSSPEFRGSSAVFDERNLASDGEWSSVSHVFTIGENEGIGSADLRFAVSGNHSVSERSADLLIGDQVFTVTQAGMQPTYALSQQSFSVNAAGDEITVSLAATPSDAPWEITSLPSWIALKGAAQGAGSAQITFAITENSSISSRANQIVVAGIPLAVVQQAMAPRFELAQETISIDASGGTLSASLTAIPADARWDVGGTPEWITLSSPQTGTGSAQIVLLVSANASLSERSAAIAIANRSLMVIQHGAPPPSIFENSEHTIDMGGGWKANALGYFYDALYPLVYSFGIGDWIFISGHSELEYYFWAFQGAHWAYTRAEYYPHYIILTGDRAGEWVEVGGGE